MNDYRHSVSVAAVIQDAQDRILCIQRADNQNWEIPGGILEKHENIMDGLRREIREETEIEIDIDYLSGVYKNLPSGIVALVFKCRPTEATASVTDETINYAWMSIDEISKNVREVFRIRIFDAIHYQNKPAIRAHDGLKII